MQDEERTEDTENVWSEQDGHTATVLEYVFSWLCGRELTRAGAVCRAWRRAASAPALWRHLLRTQRHARPAALRALCRHLTDKDLEAEWSWRDEYLRAAAGWNRVGALRAPPATPQPEDTITLDLNERNVGGAILLHAALNSRGDTLAVTSDDATVTVWKKVGVSTGAWRTVWRLSLRRRGWQSAARVQWASEPPPDEDERLLVAGPLALADRWELLVVELTRDCESGSVLARTSCGAGAAGCWATRDTFLSLELRLLAPRRGVTTVWLNAATQEAQSEFTGVSTPVLRIYNEAQAHLTHIAVAEMAKIEELDKLRSLGIEQRYMRVTVEESWERSGRRVVIAGCGEKGGISGMATALGCWALAALRVPPLCAAEGGGLAERVARRRRTPRVEDPEPPPPTEDELRALCSPPGALLSLQARLLGLELHPGGRCIWATDASGRATCAALPNLEILRVLETSPADFHSRPHYVQPAVSKWLFVSPVGSDSSMVCAWSALSGAVVAPPAPASAPVPAALLPPSASGRPLTMLLLAGDAVHSNCEKKSINPALKKPNHDEKPTVPCGKPSGHNVTTKRQYGTTSGHSGKQPTPSKSSARCTSPTLGCIKPRESCENASVKPPEECVMPPKCERKNSTTPYQPSPNKQPVKCLETAGAEAPQVCKPKPQCGKTTMECVETPVDCVRCETVSTHVSRRLEANERARRAAYLREVCERTPPEPPCTAPYKLQGASQCVAATDGRKYAVKGSLPPAPVCGSCREPPKPCCVELMPDNECKKREGHYLDPCAHRPKTIIDIDRSKASTTNKASVNENSAAATLATSAPSCGSASKMAPRRSPASKPAATTAAAKICAIMKSLTGGSKTEHTQSIPRGTATPAKKCNKVSQSGGAKQAGDNSWCDSLKKPSTATARCRPVGEAERIRRHPCPDIKCGPRASSRRKPTGRRGFHTTTVCATHKSKSSKSKDDSDKLKSVLRDRTKLKKAAQGRVVKVQEKCKKPQAQVSTGSLELPVPPGAGVVSVNVSINPKREKPCDESPPKPTDGCKHFSPNCACKSNAFKTGPKTQKEESKSATATKSKSAKPSTTANILGSGSKCASRPIPAGSKTDSWLSKIFNSRKKDDSAAAEKNELNASPCKPICGPSTQRAPTQKAKPPNSYPKPNPVCPPAIYQKSKASQCHSPAAELKNDCTSKPKLSNSCTSRPNLPANSHKEQNSCTTNSKRPGDADKKQSPCTSKPQLPRQTNSCTSKSKLPANSNKETSSCTSKPKLPGDCHKQPCPSKSKLPANSSRQSNPTACSLPPINPKDPCLCPPRPKPSACSAPAPSKTDKSCNK